MSNRSKRNSRLPYYLAASFVTLAALVIFLIIKLIPFAGDRSIKNIFDYHGQEIIVLCEEIGSSEEVHTRAKQSYDALVKGFEPIIQAAVDGISNALNEANRNQSITNFYAAGKNRASMIRVLLDEI